ncbi:MAG: tRNA (adenosine(37)-N6)-threonylcarbamoyltransferase complex ATPase subunit type 1 TsaE [Sphingobacteriales bacterium]|nr:MAG: tRNA (adenosine(37)-N6)-threonylcarbamoyltransferase complex ATPase subunit type 1 TsaE [Sphingobacteriales bacterium]
MTLTVKTISELPVTAEQLLGSFGNYRIFAFSGEMGVGKTTFIKEICRKLGSSDLVNSPTYSLANEYKGKTVIYHLDLYRLKNLEEALDIGILDYLNSGAYCLIEWPEIIEPLLDNSCVWVQLEKDEQNYRTITIRQHE